MSCAIYYLPALSLVIELRETAQVGYFFYNSRFM